MPLSPGWPGDPVFRGVSNEIEGGGVLDSPLSRAMTALMSLPRAPRSSEAKPGGGMTAFKPTGQMKGAADRAAAPWVFKNWSQEVGLKNCVLRENDLLQAGHRGQVSRELGNTGRAAPVRAWSAGIDRGAGSARRVESTGEGAAVTLRQVGVRVAQIEGENLIGKADTDVPGVIVGILDAERETGNGIEGVRWFRATGGRPRRTRRSRRRY